MNVFALLVINIVYFYNQIFGNDIEFAVNFFTYVRDLGVSIENVQSSFFLEKNKNLLINFFNITFPLLALSFIRFKINKEKITSWLLKILNIAFYLLIFLIALVVLSKLDINEIKKSLFFDTSYFLTTNPHVILFILSFSVLINFYTWLNKPEKKKYTYKIILGLVFLLLVGANLHFFSCMTLIIFMNIVKNKNYSIFFVIFFLLTLLLLLLYEYQNKEFIVSGILKSIHFRYEIINLYLNSTTNFNYIIGNNIFIKNIHMYPHNYIVDIFVCTGFFGVTLLAYIKYKLFFNISKFVKLNFLSVILIYFLIFSIFSGFFFNNISLNILLALFLKLLTEKLEKIK